MSGPGDPGRPHTARRRFGQHFLHDPAVVTRIVSAIAPRPGDALVEIGPGTGVLTAALLRELPAMQAVEIDRDLASALAARYPPSRLELHVTDALRFDFAALAREPGELRIAGNLPYNVSTPLLFHLLEARHAIRDMHFMLQREVVDRLAAAPGERSYGRLSVMVQTHCRVESLFRVGAGAFRPPPRVESAVARLLPRDSLPLPEEHLPALSRVVAAAFARRRKTLRNALRGLVGEDELLATGLDPGARPETLGVADFARLAACLAPGSRGPASC